MKELNELAKTAKEASELGVSMDYVDPETILAIAESFRALERRANDPDRMLDDYVSCDTFEAVQQRAEAAETKLAELYKQEPAGKWIVQYSITEDGYDQHSFASWRGNQPENNAELFTRPVPAVSLVELVPDESTLADKHIEWLSTLQRPMFSDEEWEDLTLYTWLAFRDSARIQRAAILSNIEEYQNGKI